MLGGDEVELFPVSARRREGLTPLLARLRKLAAEERHTLLRRSVAELAEGPRARSRRRHALSHARSSCPSISSPRGPRFRRPDRRAHSGERGGWRLARAGNRAGGQAVGQRAARALRAERGGAPPRRAARTPGAARSEGSPRELSADLEGWIDSTVRSEFERLVPRFETAIAEQLTELEQHYAQRIERLLEQVQQAAEDVFGARTSDVLPDTGLRAPSRFSFKLKDVEHPST